MRSFNGDFPPWRCSGRQRRRGEGRHHPQGNKPWKKELHHQECALDKKLEEDALMEEKKEKMTPLFFDTFSTIVSLSQKSNHKIITLVEKMTEDNFFKKRN